MTVWRELSKSSSKRGGEVGLPYWRRGVRDAKPEKRQEIGGGGDRALNDVEL